MKLHLPKVLLSFVLACLMQPAMAQSSINLNTYDWSQFQGPPTNDYPVYPFFNNVNLNINGNWTIDLRKMPDIRWGSVSGDGSYSLTGTGVMDFQGGGLYMFGGTSLPPFGCGASQYTVESGIVLKDTEIESWGGARIFFKGGLEAATLEDEVTFSVRTYDDRISTIDLSQADIQENEFVRLNFSAGKIIRDHYTVSETHSLDLDWYIEVFLGEKAINTFQGSMTLAAGGLFTLRTVSVHIDEVHKPYLRLDVTGSLSITGNTIFNFFNDGFGYVNPEAGTVVLSAKNITGDTSLLSARISSWKDAPYDSGIYQAITDKKFVSIAQTDGRYALTLVDNGYVPSQPEDTEKPTPPKVITEGKAPEILSEDVSISLGKGGTVDAREVLEGLNNLYVRGSGGMLKTLDTQNFTLLGPDTIGFSIIGEAGSAGATIQVGKAYGNILDATITLDGVVYESKFIVVGSGLLELTRHVVLGTSDSILTVGTEGHTGNEVNASVNNRGTINNDVILHAGGSLDNRNLIKGDVLINGSSILCNNGTVEGKVTISENGRVSGSGTFASTMIKDKGLLYVGNSPGFQHHDTLTLNNGARLGFYLDGLVAATETHQGSGTYSNLQVRNDLTINGTVNTEVEVGLGILSAGTEAFTLGLIKSDGTVSGHGDFQLVLKDENKLLKSGSLLWDATTGLLSFTGQVDEAVAASLVGKDGSNIANALWASTSVVKSFGQIANAQFKLTQAGQTNVWASGLGDFLNMKSTSHAGGFQYNGGGYSAGVDYAWTKKFRAGIAFGQSFGTFKSDDRQASIKQKGLMTGLYTQYLESLCDSQSLALSGYFAYGSIENKANTLVGNSSYLPGHAKWRDDVFSFGLKADWNIQVTEKTTLTPFVGLDYVHGSQASFTETYANGVRSYKEGNMQVWSLPVGVTTRTKVDLGGEQFLLPEFTVAYVGDISRTNPSVKSTIYSIENKHEGSNPGRSAFMMNAGSNWVINSNWSAGAFYTLEARSKQMSQSASLSARYSF